MNEPMTIERFMRSSANRAANNLGEGGDPFEVFSLVVEDMQEVIDNLPEDVWASVAATMTKLFETNGLGGY